MVGEFLENPVIPFGVCLGKVAAGYFFAKPQMIGFVLVRFQYRCQVPQAFPAGNLSEHHAQQLVPTSEMPDPLVAVVFGNNPVKNALRQKLY